MVKTRNAQVRATLPASHEVVRDFSAKRRPHDPVLDGEVADQVKNAVKDAAEPLLEERANIF